MIRSLRSTFLPHSKQPALAEAAALPQDAAPVTPHSRAMQPAAALIPPAAPPSFAAQLAAAQAQGDAALQALPLAPLLTAPGGKDLRLLVNAVLQRPAFVLNMRGPEARTWASLVRLLEHFGGCSAPHKDLITPLLGALLKHPQEDQRNALMRLLTKPLTHDMQRALEAVAAEQQKQAVRPCVTLARLAIAGAGLGSLVCHPRVTRFLKSRLQRDGLRMREVLGAMLALSQRPQVLSAILLYPTAPQLKSQLSALQHPLAKQWRNNQDLLTSNSHKDAVNAFYGEHVQPTLTAYLRVCAALVTADQPVLDSSSPQHLLPLTTLTQALGTALLGPGAAPAAVAALPNTLATWRNPDLLHTYARVLRSSRGHKEITRRHKYDQAFTEMLTQVALGQYAAWRSGQSRQMAALIAACPSLDAAAWNRGTQLVLGTLPAWPGHPDWTLQDTGSANDLLNAASEGARSCQRVDASPDQNGSLLGRLGDASKRMAVIKDGSGAIKGRAMLRLMANAEGQPCLLLSRTYFDRNLSQHETVLRGVFANFAKQRAAALGLVAVHARVAGTDWYPVQGEPLRAYCAPSWKPDYWDECDVPDDAAADGIRDGAVDFLVRALA